MELSNDQDKRNLVAKLVKDGTIDFEEAIMLLKKEIVYLSYPWSPEPYIPDPLIPIWPFPSDYYKTTCQS
jgi:hypothetical protein